MARDLTAEIEAIIGLDDPIGIGGPDNVGEYNPEAKDILAQLPGITSERASRGYLGDLSVVIHA